MAGAECSWCTVCSSSPLKDMMRQMHLSGGTEWVMSNTGAVCNLTCLSFPTSRANRVTFPFSAFREDLTMESTTSQTSCTIEITICPKDGHNRSPPESLVISSWVAFRHSRLISKLLCMLAAGAPVKWVRCLCIGPEGGGGGHTTLLCASPAAHSSLPAGPAE